MRQWSTAALPISLLLILAALTFWLRYATDMAETHGNGKHRHDPDYIVTDATMRKVGPSGNLQYTLFADEIRHYPDNDTTEMDSPRLVYLHPSKPPVTISAVRGHLSPKGERVDLSEKVDMQRAATAKQQALSVETPQLTVLTNEEKAFTKSPVLITQGDSWVRGVGMQVDNKLQTYLLESEVTGQIESHKSKKKR